jgi:hypothetical protein
VKFLGMMLSEHYLGVMGCLLLWMVVECRRAENWFTVSSLCETNTGGAILRTLVLQREYTWFFCSVYAFHSCQCFHLKALRHLTASLGRSKRLPACTLSLHVLASFYSALQLSTTHRPLNPSHFLLSLSLNMSSVGWLNSWLGNNDGASRPAPQQSAQSRSLPQPFNDWRDSQDWYVN